LIFDSALDDALVNKKGCLKHFAILRKLFVVGLLISWQKYSFIPFIPRWLVSMEGFSIKKDEVLPMN
jgi:hypothetical protein